MIAVIVVLLLPGITSRVAHAQGGQGGAMGSTQADPQQKMNQMLDMARGSSQQRWAQQEKRMLENIENRMKQQNTQNTAAISEAIAEVKNTLEKARKLSENDFATQKAALQQKMAQSMAKGMGRSAGGGDQGDSIRKNDGMRSGKSDDSNSVDPKSAGSKQASDSSGVNYIDVHVHLMGRSAGSGGSGDEGAAEAALTAMDKGGIQKSLLMPQPFPPDHHGSYDYEKLVSIARKAPTRFGFLGGGGTLNPMIQESVRKGNDGLDVRRKFEEKADEILRNGAAGFGEMTAEHLSFNSHHPYESAPPDHPLFLLLADIAARNDAPIDLHMEAVQHDMPIPEKFNSPPNSKTLRENIEGFERLLSHNPKARIVWAHIGWDNTGFGTVELYRHLLGKHPNLYMSVKIDSMSLSQSRPLDENDRLKPEWLDLVRSFPDRFVIGSDEIYLPPQANSRKLDRSRSLRIFLNQLPEDLARKVATENAARIYRLK